MSTGTLRLEVDLVPDPAGILAAQGVVSGLSGLVLHDEDLGWRLAMATHELLDNARKYGCDERATFQFEINAATAHMHVRSRARATDIELIRTILAGIVAAPDPWAFYVKSMEESIARNRGSGLGLARIRAEGDMALRMSVGADEYIEVSAELRVSEVGV